MTLTELKAQNELKALEIKQAKLKNEEDNVRNESYRNHVVFQELGAREAKAVFEKYDFTIRATALREEYEKVMDSNYALLKEKQAQFEKLKEDAANNTMLMATDAIPE